MATENKTTPPLPAPKGPSLSDVQARDSFIAVALREIVAGQVSTNKYNADMAATWAVRFGNAVMAVRGTETAPLKVVVAKGTLAVDPAITNTDKSVGAVVDGDKVMPVKSIAEIIGDTTEVSEVK